VPQQALANFRSADGAVSAILDIETQYPDPPPPEHRAAVEGLRGGAAVLTVAAFENYLREAISLALDNVNSSNPPCEFQKLPATLQTTSIYATLELAMQGRYETTRRKRHERILDIQAAAQRVQSGRLDGAAIANTGGNPNSELVKSLFKSIGVPNVLANVKRAFDAKWGGVTAQTFIPDTLDSVVRRRHVVAHTASALAITRIDLADGRRFVVCLSEVLDAALDRHISRVIAAAQ